MSERQAPVLTKPGSRVIRPGVAEHLAELDAGGALGGLDDLHRVLAARVGQGGGALLGVRRRPSRSVPLTRLSGRGGPAAGRFSPRTALPRRSGRRTSANRSARAVATASRDGAVAERGACHSCDDRVTGGRSSCSVELGAPRRLGPRAGHGPGGRPGPRSPSAVGPRVRVEGGHARRGRARRGRPARPAARRARCRPRRSCPRADATSSRGHRTTPPLARVRDQAPSAPRVSTTAPAPGVEQRPRASAPTSAASSSESLTSPAHGGDRRRGGRRTASGSSTSAGRMFGSRLTNRPRAASRRGQRGVDATPPARAPATGSRRASGGGVVGERDRGRRRDGPRCPRRGRSSARGAVAVERDDGQRRRLVAALDQCAVSTP